MLKRPVVSVIMPFFDTPAAFFDEAVASVVGQSLEGWELLLVDDGSGEECTARARGFAAEHPDRIRYLEHEGHANRGASASRNLGLAEARGDFMALLDADDLWLPEKLSEQIAILKSQPDAGMLYGNTLYWHSWTGRPEDSDRDFIPPLGVTTEMVHPPPTLLSRFLRGGAAVPCTCSLLLRRDVIDRTGGFDEDFTRVYTDQVFYAKVCLAVPVYVAGGCWDRYRQHPESSVHVAGRTNELSTARQRYLEWLQDYVNGLGVRSVELEGVLKDELAEFDPRRTVRVSRYLQRRARKLLHRWRN
jgi:glycosyltransferase involved in cell wall biosynthesis